MEHAWCRDPSRDERVRAAEDGRTGPLPTLGEAIAAPFACTSCGGFGMDHRCRESCDQCDGSGRAMIPKSGSASSAVEPENKGDGMRTERVTLEVIGWTHGVPSSEEMSRCLKTCGLLAIDKPSYVRVIEPAAQAASGGGEPVAWGVIDERQKVREQFEERDDAVSYARAASYGRIVEKQKLTVAPLYRAPPQPRGWLTEEEREAVQWAADAAYDKQHPAEDTLRNILARSSPPEVDLPISLSPIDEELIRAALAAAGVAVKEVG